MKKLPLALIACFIALCSFAQDGGWEKGYILTLENKKIEGLVKNIEPFPYKVLTRIRFKKKKNDDVTTYAAKELLGYGRDGKTYVSIRHEDGVDFFELKIDGYLKLYGMTATYVFLRKTDEKVIYEVSKRWFKKELVKYLIDAPLLCREIDYEKLTLDDIEEIVRRYNLEVDR